MSDARIRVEFRGERPEWWRDVAHRLGELSHLRANWDSYGAAPVQSAAAAETVRFLLSVLPATAPPPQLVPTPAGGLQAEWHRDGLDVEVEFPPGGPAEFLIEELSREAMEGLVSETPEGHAGFGLVAFRAGLAREYDLGVARDPTDEEPAHAVVFGKKTKKVSRALAQGCDWLVPPGW